MKKLISILLSLFILVLSLCSCGTNRIHKKIKSITVDTYKYETIYLYSFKNAKLDLGNIVKDFSPETAPTQTGYVLSTSKLDSGDEVKVWTQHYFGEDYYHSSQGTTAVVDKLVETYSIKIDNKNETYLISLFNVNEPRQWNTHTVSEKTELEVVFRQIEVTKDRVTIEYDVK